MDSYPNIVVEMIKTAGETGATMIRNLATAIIRDGKIPTDWEQSFIVCFYKGKGDAMDRLQADRAGHEDPREDCRRSHKTRGVY